MLQIWGRPNSINVQKVMWTVAELGLDHERYDVGGPFGGLDTSEFLARNPHGTIPVLKDGDVVLWESNAIVRYLMAKHSAGNMWPTDLVARARTEAWMDWQASSTIIDLLTAFFGLIRTPEAERDMAKINLSVSKLNNMMTVLDQQLAEQTWVMGDNMTMADIAVGALVYRWSEMPMDRPALANVANYYAMLQKRESFRSHVMIPLS